MSIYGQIIFNGENEGFVNEASLYTEPKLSLHVDPDQLRVNIYLKDPYIKIANASSWTKASLSARYSMKTGKILPSHSDGKGDLILNQKELNYLTNLMDVKCNCGKFRGLSIYDAFYEQLKYQFPNESIIKFDKPVFKNK